MRIVPVDTANLPKAARLYRRMGFKETATIRVVPNGLNEIELTQR